MGRPASVSKMFFLLRTVFWLGVTFSAMEWPGERPALPTTGDIAMQVTRLCAENAAACLKAAGAANAAMKPAEKPAEAASKSAPVKIDTLGSADRGPAWRGRSQAATRSISF